MQSLSVLFSYTHVKRNGMCGSLADIEPVGLMKKLLTYSRAETIV